MAEPLALDRLVEEIRRKGQEEIRQISDRAAAEEKAIADDVARRVTEIVTDSKRKADLAAAREVAQKVAGAKLQGRKLVFEAREKKTAELFDAVRSALQELTESAEYPALLKRMYAFAVDQLGKQIRVVGRREDASTLKSVAGKAFSDGPVPILGGLIAETVDGARRLNLSFDELLRLREDRVRTVLGS